MRSRQVLEHKQNQSPNPYPQQFHVSSSLRSYVEKYGVDGKIAPGTKLEVLQRALLVVFIISELAALSLNLHGEGTKVHIIATEQ